MFVGFDISVDKLLFMNCGQSGSHLRRNFQRQLHLNPTRTSNEMLKGLSLDELHCIKVTAPGSTEVEDRGNIRVPHAGRRTRLAQETKPRRFITEIPLADDFKRHGAVQIDVERLVSDPHCTATQLDRFPVFALRQFIMLKSLRCLFRRRLNGILGSRRLAGLNPVSKSLAKHADRTELCRSRKLVATARTGALGLRFHGPTRPSAAI